MAVAEELVILIKADAQKAVAAFNQTKQAAMQSADVMKKAGMMMTAGLTVPIIAFAKASLDAYAKTEKGKAIFDNLNKTFGELQATIGELIFKRIEPLIKGATDLLKWFDSLDESTQNMIITLGGLVAAAGPVMGILGSIQGLAAKMGASFAGMIGPIGLVVAGIGALVALRETGRPAEQEKMIMQYMEKQLVAGKDIATANKDVAAQLGMQEESVNKILETHGYILQDGQLRLKAEQEVTEEYLKQIVAISKTFGLIVDIEKLRKSLGFSKPTPPPSPSRTTTTTATTGPVNTETIIANEYAMLEEHKSINQLLIDNEGATQNRIQEMREESMRQYVEMAQAAADFIAPVMEDLGAALVTGASAWDILAEAGKAAVAKILEALGQQAFAQMLIDLAALNFPGAALWAAAGAAAYTAAGAVKALAGGGEMTVDGPTAMSIGGSRFLVGERGPETVSVRPVGSGGGATVIVHGSILSERDIGRIIARQQVFAARGY